MCCREGKGAGQAWGRKPVWDPEPAGVVLLWGRPLWVSGEVSRRGIGACSRLSAGRDAEEENEDEAEGSGWVRRENGAIACI